ncbi:MAG TPA: MFS transporter [Anaerolineaceae bacterium]|nr:MFS transporter [Anaerolineaceae bacterium]
MFSRIERAVQAYPRQFWLLSLLMMLAWLFYSIIWSYLLLYFSQRLGKPISGVAWLMTLNAIVGVASSFLGGSIADRFGRKGVMVFALLFSAMGWFFFRSAGNLPVVALLIVVTGATTPLYRLATDAMVADLVPVDKRLDAYSMMRMWNNLGVAIGPAIGGFLISISYFVTFSVVGIGFAVIGVLGWLLMRETGTRQKMVIKDDLKQGRGYRTILQDRIFVKILGAYTLNRVCTSILWVTLAAYTKQNFGLSESTYGFIPATNAIMVITLQLLITRQVNRHRPSSAMVVGTLIYAISIFSVAFGEGFWWFWLCMVGATVGEMILVPTTTTFTSNLAPPDLRARYMSLYTFTWTIGTGLGPLLAGFAGDLFTPRAMWYTAGLAGFASFLIFLSIHRSKSEILPENLDAAAGDA